MKFFHRDEAQHEDPVLDALRGRITAALIPDSVRTVITREFDLLARAGSATSEYAIGLAYLEYILSLPWDSKTDDVLDLTHAESVLNRDHYGLGKVKERVLEHLAVKQLKMQKKARIMVVDDEEIVRRNMRHILEKEGYIVETASHGQEAINRLPEGFDVILTDFKMERVDGLEVLEHARRVAPSARVIMVTGYATVNSAVEAMKKGAFHYIAKPFKIEEVRETVRKAVEGAAVRVDTRGPVLCFAGPPGTGKTSMARSIARALGRNFARIALGGVKDEAEIRGHRRTYAGAMPGRIVDEIRKIGTMNPVMILDELDKVGQDVKGDPASALLEVLDPEQNSRFVDHYLDIPFDLSDVMFIVTANVEDTIPAPLRDRMEVIRFTGYTDDEKQHIATEYLIPRQISDNGLAGHRPDFSEEAVRRIIRDYTYEAGIRGLNREIASVCRKLATDYVRHARSEDRITVDAGMVERLLGPRKFFFETAAGADRVGVTTGLVWTDVGGEIIFVEAARMKGRQDLILTGSLGEVMRESAQTALSYIRSNAAEFGIREDFFEGHDIHIHVPAGGVPKDGPSAGLTIALALVSLLSSRPAHRGVAMSGELTLSGRILPVGGIKEKVLAALRARMTEVVLPSLNRPDLEAIAAELPGNIAVSYADTVAEVVKRVLRQG